MAIGSGRCVAVLGTIGLVAALVGTPRTSAAQCSMMGGGGAHGHGDRQDRPARKTAGASRRIQRSIDRLLADEQGRAQLAAALLDDRSFMTDFLARVLRAPEWRARAAQELAGPPPAAGDDHPASSTGPAALYACPMHPDVTSSVPGECPTCGMKLVPTSASKGK